MIALKMSLALALSSIAICPVYAGSGRAAVYSGGRTASGEVRVTNHHNGKTVVVRIVDRGPYGRGRIIDVSRAAAVELDMISAGTVMVSIERQ